MKLADNFQIRKHSWPCLFHIMQALASSLWYKMCTKDFFDKHGFTYCWIKKNSAHCKHVPCNTLTHTTNVNEDLLNIKRTGDPKSRTSDTTETRNQCAKSCTSDTTETRNQCVISHFVSLFYLY